MSTSSVSGSGTVIDVNGIVNSLMQVEQRPLATISSKISSTNVSISAMSELKGAVDSVYSAVAAIESPLLLASKTVAVSDTSAIVATVTDSSTATVGLINVETTSLAQAQRITVAGGFFNSTTEALDPGAGDGMLKISIPPGSSLLTGASVDTGVDVEISVSGISLAAVRDQINTNASLKSSIRADLVNTGKGEAPWVLVLTGLKTGASADFVAQFQSSSAVEVSEPSQSASGAQEVIVSAMALANASSATLNSVGNGELLISIPPRSSLLSGTTSGAQFKLSTNGKTLNEVRDLINNDPQLALSIQADVIQDGSGAYVLQLTGRVVDNDGTFFVSYDNIGRVAEALNAHATVGGVAVESETNVFAHALPGVQFEVKKTTTPNAPISVQVSDNKAEITSKVSSFATAFTTLVQKIRTLTKPGSESAKPGALASNAGVLGLSASVMSAYSQGFRLTTPGELTQDDGALIGQTVYENGQSYTQLTWAHLGLELSRDGAVVLNAARLSDALSGSVGRALVGGFTSNLKASLDTFRGVSGSLQNVVDTMRTSVSNLKGDQEKTQARIDRLRASYIAKYAALDAKLVQMRQMSSNVQASLAGLAR
jgi:flagellar hook-associated protein 2